MFDKYVMTVVSEDGTRSVLINGEHSYYYTREINSGRSKSILPSDTVYFDSIEEIKALIETHPEFNKEHTYDGGSVSPPLVFWRSLGICHARPKSSGTVSILKVSISVAEEFPTKEYQVT